MSHLRLSSDEASSDLDCMVCYRLLVEPTKLPCSHILCITCVQELSDFGGPACPMCRNPLPENFLPLIDYPTVDRVRKRSPSTFLREFQERKETNQLEQMLLRIKIKVGNLSSLYQKCPFSDKNDRFQWTFYLKSDDIDLKKIIRKVRLELPKDYATRTVDIEGEIKFTSVGSSNFNLPVKIYWKPGVLLPTYFLEHQMKLGHEGNEGFLVVKMPRKDLPFGYLRR